MIKDGKITIEIIEQEAQALENIIARLVSKDQFTKEERQEIATEITEVSIMHHETGYFQGLRDALDPENRAYLLKVLREHENRNGGSRPS